MMTDLEAKSSHEDPTSSGAEEHAAHRPSTTETASSGPHNTVVDEPVLHKPMPDKPVRDEPERHEMDTAPLDKRDSEVGMAAAVGCETRTPSESCDTPERRADLSSPETHLPPSPSSTASCTQTVPTQTGPTQTGASSNAETAPVETKMTLEKMMSTQSSKTSKSEREYKLIIWGATGYTGKLACEYMLQYNMERVRRGQAAIPWAPAGRNRSSLESLTATLRMHCKAFSEKMSRQDSGKSVDDRSSDVRNDSHQPGPDDRTSDAPIGGHNRQKGEATLYERRRSRRMDSGDWEVFGTKYLCVDLENINDVKSMTARTAVVAAFAGPFAVCGEAIIRACLSTNTDYVDATAELYWVGEMVEKFHSSAEALGLTFLPCCGYDFLMNDMMMFQLTQYLAQHPTLQTVPCRVRHLFQQSNKSVSGGTARSGLRMLSEVPLRKLVHTYVDPYSMVQHPPSAAKSCGNQMASERLKWESDMRLNNEQNQLPETNRYWIFPEAVKELEAYVAPFVMSSLMSKYIHWANQKSDYAWGKQLIYRGGIKRKNLFIALYDAILIWFQFLGVIILSRIPLLWELLPKPGDGPRIGEDAFLGSDLVATVYSKTAGPPTTVRISWGMQGIEAYKAAAIFVVHCAMVLAAKDPNQKPQHCGFTTPSVALGAPLLKQLKEAGVQMSECEVPSL